MRHRRSSTPAYLVWVEHRPSSSAKGKATYFEAVRAAAASEIINPIVVDDVEVEIIYSTVAQASQRLDTDNVNKPTLDALTGIAYLDDAQVRSVTSTLFDRNINHVMDGRVEHMGRLFYSPNPHVVLILIYSDSRLAELGGEHEVQRRRYKEWQRDFDRTLAGIREQSA